MTARTVLPAELEKAAKEHEEVLAFQLCPADPYERFLVREMAVATAQIEAFPAIMLADLGRSIDRVILCWDQDRREQIEDQAARLSKDCARVSRRLKGSKQGVEFLLERWHCLAQIARTNGAWTAAQRQLAYDMLGASEVLRDGGFYIPVEDNAGALVEVAEQEIGWLEESLERSLLQLDANDRAMAASGMAMFEDATSKRFRRYNASNRRALSWARKELDQYRALAAGKAAAQAAASEETEKAEAEPEAKPRPRPRSAEWADERSEFRFPVLPEAGLDYLVDRAQLMTLDRGIDADQRLAAAMAAEAGIDLKTEPEPELEPEPVPSPAVVPPTFVLPTSVPPMTSAPAFGKTGSSMGMGPKPPENRRQRKAAEARARKARKR